MGEVRGIELENTTIKRRSFGHPAAAPAIAGAVFFRRRCFGTGPGRTCAGCHRGGAAALPDGLYTGGR